jgi:hypothetical protein
MLGFIKDIFRKRALKKHSNTLESSLMPLGQIGSTAVLLDVEDSSYDQCKDAVNSFFKTLGIKVDIYYIDFRKLGKEELLLTSIQNTILKKECNWYGVPEHGKLEKLTAKDESRYDLLINLVDFYNFSLEYIIKTSTAKFKIGTLKMDGAPYDLIISGGAEETNCLRMFNEIKTYLSKIG